MALQFFEFAIGFEPKVPLKNVRQISKTDIFFFCLRSGHLHEQ
jgi:hypothetical protein